MNRFSLEPQKNLPTLKFVFDERDRKVEIAWVVSENVKNIAPITGLFDVSRMTALCETKDEVWVFYTPGFHKWRRRGKKLVLRNGNETFWDKQLLWHKGKGKNYWRFQIIFC